MGGATYGVKLGTRYPEVRNDSILVAEFTEKVASIISVIPCELKQTAEDFGYFTNLYPSLMFWLGTGIANRPPVCLHHRDFHPNDSVIDLGTSIWMKLLGGD